MYEQIKMQADEVVDGAERYFDLRKELLKLQLAEKLSTSLSDLILIFIVLLFTVAGLFLICIAAGFVIQEFLNNWALAAMGALLVFALMAYFSIRFGQTRLKDSITKAITKSIYE